MTVHVPRSTVEAAAAHCALTVATHGLAAQLRACLEKTLAQEPGWLPIETAPLDDTEILVSGIETDEDMRWVTVASFHDGAWRDEYSQAFLPPTHWQHLPSPPSASAPARATGEGGE